MMQTWLFSYPELELLNLDLAPGGPERRSRERIFPFSALLADSEEKALLAVVDMLARGQQPAAAALAVEHSRLQSRLPDMHLLAGALLLAEGRSIEAAEALGICYRIMQDSRDSSEEAASRSALNPGDLVRRVYPGLRLILRISPALLLPLYPDEYAAALCYCVALWHSGQRAAALEIVREQLAYSGINDELKLLAGQLYLGHGDVDAALNALTAPDQSQRDSVELARCLYLAAALVQREKYQPAARELHAALLMVDRPNSHLHARARLLLADCLDHVGHPLAALRSSGVVQPHELPGTTAAELLAAEQRRIEKLEGLSNAQLEALAMGNEFTSIDDAGMDTGSPRKPSPLDIGRDPLGNMRPVELSWLKRQAEEKQLAGLREAQARGETVTVTRPAALTAQGRLMKSRVDAALAWWPSRREALEHAAPRERLAWQDATEVTHLRIDFAGTREPSGVKLHSERRTELLAGAVALVAVIVLVLILARACVY